MNSATDITQREIDIRRKLRDDFEHYAAKCLKIRIKKGEIQPLVLNAAQLYLHQRAEDQRKRTGKVRIIGLKGRQQGFSTYVEGRFYWRISHRKGVKGFILTHEQPATDNLFAMTERYHEHCPSLVKPHTGKSNAKELSFDLLDSSYEIGTAGTKGVGRSNTLQYLHGSEVGFWPNAESHAAGLLQCVPDEPDTEVFLESTGNGIGNFFHQTWQEAEAGIGEFEAVFVPWFWEPGYRKELPEGFSLTPEELALKDFYMLDDKQIMWRRAKIIELKSEQLFKQEYPCTAAEAFQVTGVDSLISAENVMKARKSNVDPYGPLIVGVDPAGEGKDRTAIAFRRTRKVTKVDYHKGKKPMEIVGICAQILKNHKPAAMFIDVGERGHGIVDRLRELGWQNVIGVNFGSSAINDKLYYLRRSEMWALMRDWFEEGGVQIPDNDELHADITAPSHTTDSNNRVVLEKKELMKKRGLRSPDGGDAIALTFAAPVSEGMPEFIQERPDYFGALNG